MSPVLNFYSLVVLVDLLERVLCLCNDWLALLLPVVRLCRFASLFGSDLSLEIQIFRLDEVTILDVLIVRLCLSCHRFSLLCAGFLP